MQPVTKDAIQSKSHELKGKVKEKAVQVTSNPKLANAGQPRKIGGKIQKKAGQVEKVLEK